MDPVILVTVRGTRVRSNDIFDLDDLVMLIGSDQDRRLLEVGVAEADGVEFIVHAMAADRSS